MLKKLRAVIDGIFSRLLRQKFLRWYKKAFFTIGELPVSIPPYWWGIISFFLLIIIFGIIGHLDTKFIKKEIDPLSIAGIPLFIVTIASLVKSYRVQTAGFVRDHIANFLANKDLYSAFHDLIYKYNDDVWKNTKKLCQQTINGYDPFNIKMDKCWVDLQNINTNKQQGSRFYHPAVFQGSLEEQRLDAVLHYFDILAYNRKQKLISIDDITGVSGYHLTVIGSRRIIRYYLNINKVQWKKLPYHKKMRSEEPFKNLRRLLFEIKLRNIKMRKKIKNNQ